MTVTIRNHNISRV